MLDIVFNLTSSSYSVYRSFVFDLCYNDLYDLGVGGVY